MNVSNMNRNVALALGQCTFQKPVHGEGSFGSVVRVIHKVSGSHYAVKMMTISNCSEHIKYQKREVDLLVKLQLSHRNTIQYFHSWISVSKTSKYFVFKWSCVGQVYREIYV